MATMTERENHLLIIFGTIRQVEFSICHLHLISDTLIYISRYFGTRVEDCLFDRFVLFGDQKIFYPTIHFIRESDPSQVSADSFYSANGKYYARSDILCSPSENCMLLVKMTPCKFVDSADSLTSRVSVCSIQRMENIMLDLTYCALHPKIAFHE